MSDHVLAETTFAARTYPHRAMAAELRVQEGSRSAAASADSGLSACLSGCKHQDISVVHQLPVITSHHSAPEVSILPGPERDTESSLRLS